MTATFRREDRVIIRAVENTSDSIYIGREGRYMGRSGMGNTGAYIVQTRNPFFEQDNAVVRASRVEHVADVFKAGDRVVIAEMTSDDVHARRYRGASGIYVRGGLVTGHLVNVNGLGVYAKRVTRPEAPSSNAFARGPEIKPDTAETPVAEEVLIDAKRAQAAACAHQLLGKDALLEDLIGLAEFILGERPSTATMELTSPVDVDSAPAREALAELVKSASDSLRAVIDAVKAGREIPLEEAQEVVAKDLQVMEGLEIAFDKSPDDDVVRILIDGGDRYIRSDEVDGIIRFLQAAKVVHWAR